MSIASKPGCDVSLAYSVVGEHLDFFQLKAPEALCTKTVLCGPVQLDALFAFETCTAQTQSLYIIVIINKTKRTLPDRKHQNKFLTHLSKHTEVSSE